MELATYSQILEKLNNDLDLFDVDFVSQEELLGYMNEAIDDAETAIHMLGLEAKYFLNTDTLTLVSGQTDYDPPSDIFASKVVKMFYINGPKNYEIFRIRDLRETPYIQPGEDYKYLMLNLTAGIKWRFFPTPLESGALITRYYIRNVRKLTSSTDASNTCEIPECINFLYAHVKAKIWAKEVNPNLMEAKADVKTQYDLMNSTLQEMVPDEDNTIQGDFTHYEDMYLDLAWRS